MLTLNDIINVSFRKSNFSGYRTEDVDEFIDEVKEMCIRDRWGNFPAAYYT